MKYIIRLFKMAKPWKYYIIAATFTLIAATAVSLAAPLIVRRITEIWENNRLAYEMRSVVTLALILLGLYALRAVFRFLTSYLPHIASWRLVAFVRVRLYNQFQSLSMSYYHDKQTGELMSKVVNDTATFENLIAHAIPDLITSILTLIGVYAILLSINTRLAMLISIPIPLILLMSFIVRRIRKHFRVGQEKIAELNSVLQDNFSGMKEIQVFNKQEHESGRVSKSANEYSNALIRALYYMGILHPSVEFIASIGMIIMLIAGPMLALSTGFSMPDLFAFLLYLAMLYPPITQLARMVEDFQSALAGAERVFEVLDTESSIQDKPNAISVGKLSGQLSFNHVSFSYKDDLQVLDDITINVQPGEMVALVGPTGVGKSTISALITRFYDPDSGSITMDGIDLRDMTLESLRNQLSLVLQDVFLFNGTISENIAYGSAEATFEQIKSAARTACIAEYIESLPERYDTVIGERGVRLSGGQKQRISIARSVLRNSPILILDEATSSVDTETEKEIQQAISSIAGTRTLIVIAHRLSTIQSADKIVVLEGGRIVEQGKHDELIRQNGAYAKLCNIQNLN